MSARNSSEDRRNGKGSPDKGSSGKKEKQKEKKQKRVRLLKVPHGVKQYFTEDKESQAQILHPHLSHFRKSIDKMVTLTQEKMAIQSSEIQHRKMMLSDTMRNTLHRAPIQHLQRKLLPRDSLQIPEGLWTEDSSIPQDLLENNTLSHAFENLTLVVMDDEDEDDHL